MAIRGHLGAALIDPGFLHPGYGTGLEIEDGKIRVVTVLQSEGQALTVLPSGEALGQAEMRLVPSLVVKEIRRRPWFPAMTTVSVVCAAAVAGPVVNVTTKPIRGAPSLEGMIRRGYREIREAAR